MFADMGVSLLVVFNGLRLLRNRTIEVAVLSAELKAFYRVAQLGSITQAAKKLGLSQPTVTITRLSATPKNSMANTGAVIESV